MKEVEKLLKFGADIKKKQRKEMAKKQNHIKSWNWQQILLIILIMIGHIQVL